MRAPLVGPANPTPARFPPPPSVGHSILTALASLELVLLGIQFALGMFLNLYVALPPFGSYGMMGMMTTSGMPALMAHMMVGYALGALSLVILAGAVAVAARSRLLVGTTAATFVSILVAGIGGLAFLFGSQNDADSYVMSTGFLFAFTFAFLSLLLATRGGWREPPPRLTKADVSRRERAPTSLGKRAVHAHPWTRRGTARRAALARGRCRPRSEFHRRGVADTMLSLHRWHLRRASRR